MYTGTSGTSTAARANKIDTDDIDPESIITINQATSINRSSNVDRRASTSLRATQVTFWLRHL